MSEHNENHERNRAIDTRLDELADCASSDEQIDGLKDLIEALCNNNVPEHVQVRMDVLAENDSTDDEIEGLSSLVEEVRAYGFPLRNVDAHPSAFNLAALNVLLPMPPETVESADSTDPLMPELTPSWAPKM